MNVDILMDDNVKVKALTEYFENLTPKQQRQLFIMMFNELEEQEIVGCYISGEHDTYHPDFRVYWDATGENLIDGLK